jgi:ATP-dependent DNA ligase
VAGGAILVCSRLPYVGSPSSFHHVAYIGCMVLRSSRGRPLNAPAAFIHPCQPIVAKQPPNGPSWAHEPKHDGYRLQIHVRDGRVRLYTINGADWSKRYPLIVRAASRIQGAAVMDAEVVWLDLEGVPNFDALHSRVNDQNATACAFDLLMLNGDDLRRKRYVERKSALRKLLRMIAASSRSNTPRVTATNCLLPLASLA